MKIGISQFRTPIADKMVMQLPTWIEPADPGMPDPQVEYFDDGTTVSRVLYFNNKGSLHKKNGPAHIRWHENGLIEHEGWYHKGKAHRENGPALANWYLDGAKSR